MSHVSTRLSGNTKVTREDWLKGARDLLISHGVADVKVQAIGSFLGVSRCTFYWYFKSHEDLLDALLKDWQQCNTDSLINHAAMPSATITEAVCDVFRCWIDERLFNHRLDFAVREWARREASVRALIDEADAARIKAFSQMFIRHRFNPKEAKVRARILYYMQVGYYALEISETMEERLRHVPDYLYGFTDVMPSEEEIKALKSYAREVTEHG